MTGLFNRSRNCLPVVLGLLCAANVLVNSADGQQSDKPKKQAKQAAETKIDQPELATSALSVDFTDPEEWKFADDGWKLKVTDSKAHTSVLSLHKKASNYLPFYRSPRHIAWLKTASFESFELDVDILSTHKDYNHRDVCLFFGYQSPSEFYYVHLGKKTDPHANQIFIVNKAERIKISTKTTPGTNWDQKWHHVRVRRDATTGQIRVFFDDMDEPVMIAKDKTFGRGLVGLGSFDDTADFDNLKIKPLMTGKQ